MTDEVSAPTFHLATCLRPSRCTQSSDSSELTLRRHTDPALLGHPPLFIGCLPSMSPFPITTVLLPPPVHVCQLSAPNQCLVSVVSSVTFRPPASALSPSQSWQRPHCHGPHFLPVLLQPWPGARKQLWDSIFMLQ